MNRLQGTRVYLAGPMDRCPNGGIQWRSNLKPFLKSLGVTVFDPTDKPINIGTENIERREYRKILKQKRQFNRLSAEVREISNVDLRMVDICDFIIAHLDLEIYPAGTVWEIVTANLQKKPILLHFEQGVLEIPDWYFGRLPWHEFFGDWEELKGYLSIINKDSSFNPGKRWYFFDKDNI